MLKIFIALSLICAIISPIPKERVLVAINCGGQSYVDGNGIIYEKDNYFDAGQTSDYGLQYDIKLTKDEALYQTERWHSDSFIYSVPLKHTGKFVIILKFSEVYFNEPGDKVFDIAIGKKVVVKDLDIYGKVGKAAAHDEYIQAELRDDKVFINGEEASAAYEPKNKLLRIRFVKGKSDNPKINAIILVRGDLKETDFEEKKKVYDDVKKKKFETLKKSLYLQRRHSLDEEIDDIQDDGSEELPQAEEVTPISIFLTRNGAYIISSLFVFLGFYFVTGMI